MTTGPVRPFTDADYTAYARITTIAEGRTLDAAGARAEDALLDTRIYVRLRLVVPDEEDVPLGYGEIRHEPGHYEPHRYRLRLGVDTRERRRGIGASLWDGLEAELARRSAEWVDLWAADHTACQAFIVKRGFAEVIRAYEQVLAVASAPLPTPASEERAAAAGIRVVTLAELHAERGAAALESAADLDIACRADHESTLGRVAPIAQASWTADHLTDADALPDAHFMALDGDELVAMSCARRQSDDTLRIGVTGVLPSHRRRGLGRLLKLRLHAWAKRNGYSEIHTTTTKPNVGMIALNDALGYAIVGSRGGYELRLGR